MPGGKLVARLIPFGAQISFMPSLTDKRDKGKYEARAVPGVYLGQTIQRGGAFRNSHYAVSLHDLREFRLMKRRLPYIHETMEVFLPPVGTPWEFPAKVKVAMPPRIDQLRDPPMPER
eukprot:5772720-Alexandrium_andersonii.AAC.1